MQARQALKVVAASREVLRGAPGTLCPVGEAATLAAALVPLSRPLEAVDAERLAGTTRTSTPGPRLSARVDACVEVRRGWARHGLAAHLEPRTSPRAPAPPARLLRQARPRPAGPPC